MNYFRRWTLRSGLWKRCKQSGESGGTRHCHHGHAAKSEENSPNTCVGEFVVTQLDGPKTGQSILPTTHNPPPPTYPPTQPPPPPHTHTYMLLMGLFGKQKLKKQPTSNSLAKRKCAVPDMEPAHPPPLFAGRPNLDPPPFQKSWIRPCSGGYPGFSEGGGGCRDPPNKLTSQTSVPPPPGYTPETYIYIKFNMFLLGRSHQ